MISDEEQAATYNKLLNDRLEKLPEIHQFGDFVTMFIDHLREDVLPRTQTECERVTTLAEIEVVSLFRNTEGHIGDVIEGIAKGLGIGIAFYAPRRILPAAAEWLIAGHQAGEHLCEVTEDLQTEGESLH